MSSGILNVGKVATAMTSKSVAGNATVTLTDAESRANTFYFDGAVTGAHDVVIPGLLPGTIIVIDHNSTGNFAVTFKGPVGAGIASTSNGTRKRFNDAVSEAVSGTAPLLRTAQ